MESYELLFHDDALSAYQTTRGAARQNIQAFCDAIVRNPHFQPDVTYLDRKGRLVSKYRINGHVIDYVVDHPVRELKVMRIMKVRA